MKILQTLTVALAATAALGSCSGSGTGTSDTDARAVAIADSAFGARDVSIEPQYLRVTVDLPAGLAAPQAVGTSLAHYMMACKLKRMSADEVNTIAEALRASDSELYLTLTDSTQEKGIAFGPTQLLDLRKARPIELDLPAVRADIAAAAASSQTATAMPDGATAVATAVDGGFITITYTFASDKSYGSHDQGLLTARYLAPLKAAAARAEQAWPGITGDLKEIKIEGIRIVYTSDAPGAVTLKQAFPWRILTE